MLKTSISTYKARTEFLENFVRELNVMVLEFIRDYPINGDLGDYDRTTRI